MSHSVIIGSGKDGEAVASAVAALPLARAPSTCVVIAVRDHERLPFEVRALSRTQDRVIVVAVNPIPDPIVDDVVQIADDYLEWDDSTIDAIGSRLDRWHEIDTILESPEVRSVAVGSSASHLDSLAQIVELALYSEAPVLLTGETGTGKEVAARLLHSLSRRRDANFVIVDSCTIQPTLAGSELFGHERGAFTGAVSSRTGAFALADGGTLFLDEVGELPLPIQAELLRVIQEGTYKRVGGDRWHTTQFRLVCATNRDLHAEMTAGRFRQDLFHRIAAGVVHLCPLRERLDDIEPLFASFLTEAMGGAHPHIADSVVRLLRERDYPGNLRDLRQVAVRIASRHTGPGSITLGDVPKNDRVRAAAAVRTGRPASDLTSNEAAAAAEHLASVREAVRGLMRDGRTLKDVSRIVADTTFELALETAGGSTRAAARLLGVSERAIQLRRAAMRAVSSS